LLIIWLAKHDLPFREAHHIVGSLVGDLSRAGKNFRDTQDCLDHIIKKNKVPADPKTLAKVFDPKAVMMSYNTEGGTGPIAVKDMIKKMRAQLAEHKKVVQADKDRLANALKTTRTIAEKAASIKTADDLKNLVPKDYRTE